MKQAVFTVTHREQYHVADGFTGGIGALARLRDL
jgi:hypothetical protein